MLATARLLRPCVRRQAVLTLRSTTSRGQPRHRAVTAARPAPLLAGRARRLASSSSSSSSASPDSVQHAATATATTGAAPYHPGEISAAQIAAVVAENPGIVNQVERLVPSEQKKAVRQQLKLALSNKAMAAEAYKQMDKNKDGTVSQQEFMSWWAEIATAKRATARRFHALQDSAAAAGSAVGIEAAGAATATAAAGSAGGETVAAMSWKQLGLIGVVSGIPMVGFGFVDNLIMIVAGDAIDMTLGVTFGLTALAAAGLGNAFSDVCGVYLGGVIETVAAKVGVKPNVSRAQLATRAGRVASSTGGALGIFLGCLLGMFPLLFMDHDARKLNKMFADVDLDADGLIDEAGVKTVLKRTGMRISEDQLALHPPSGRAQPGQRDVYTLADVQAIMGAAEPRQPTPSSSSLASSSPPPSSSPTSTSPPVAKT